MGRGKQSRYGEESGPSSGDHCLPGHSFFHLHQGKMDLPGASSAPLPPTAATSFWMQPVHKTSMVCVQRNSRLSPATGAKRLVPTDWQTGPDGLLGSKDNLTAESGGLGMRLQGHCLAGCPRASSLWALALLVSEAINNRTLISIGEGV